MNSLSLTEEQRKKLLEMCVKLFPEYSNIYISSGLGILEGTITFISNNKLNTAINIYWFEFCILKLSAKLFIKGNMNIALFLENTLNGVHPVDYLYKEFKNIN